MKINKKNLTMTVIVLVIVIIIFGINTLTKPDDSEILNPNQLQCISEHNHTLYVSKTCSHCAKQKALLSSCLDDIHVIDCTKNMELCKENGITQVPTWVINGEKYVGVKTIDEITELCGCPK